MNTANGPPATGTVFAGNGGAGAVTMAGRGSGGAGVATMTGRGSGGAIRATTGGTAGMAGGVAGTSE